MEIIHKVSQARSNVSLDELAALGVRQPKFDALIVTFSVAESDRNWPAVKRWIEERRPAHSVSTTFTAEEIDEAGWLMLLPDWHHGYPQPNAGQFGYRQVTYDLDGYCPVCGIGMRQKAPFRMSGEPRWGRRALLQLNWVFDEYFARPEVWSTIFEPLAVPEREVLAGRGKEPLANVVQLVAQEEVDVATDDLPTETCAVCGRVRHPPNILGFFPPIIGLPRSDLLRTRQWFGSGAAAHNRILVSQGLARALRAGGVAGVSFHPLASG